MPNDIHASPTRGVGPARSTCFFCGRKTGTVPADRPDGGPAKPGTAFKVATVGSDTLTGTTDAHAYYEPCDVCKAAMARGYTLIGATEDRPPDGRPPIVYDRGKPYYPDDSLLVVTEHCIRTIFTKAAAKDVLRTGKAVVSAATTAHLNKCADNIAERQDR